MGLLSGFIGGAAQAGGEILQRERESGTRIKENQDISRFNDELQGKREAARLKLQEEMGIRAEGRAVQARRDEEAYQASPERIDQQVAADAMKQRGLIQTGIDLAPDKGRLAQAEFDAGAGTRQAAQQEKLRFSLDDYKQKSAAELEAEVKKLNDPKYLQGKAKEAAAGRDPNSAALHRVQLETAQLALKEKQAEGKIPPAVKLMAEPVKKEMDLIAAAIAKAQAENMFDATSENGKALLTRHAEAASRLSSLLTQYLPEGAKTPDKPAPVNAWDDSTGDVLVNGKVIGKAKSPAEAKAMIASAGAKPQAPQKTAAPVRPDAPKYIPPPDSPAGKRQAAMAQRKRQLEQEKASKANDAAASFNAVGNDPIAAAALQDSPLFGRLTREQKAKIFQLVRGR